MRMHLSLPLSLSLLATGIHQAQASEDDIYELITTAIHSRHSETALPVTVLGGDELHAAARATLGDTLSAQPGINNASFGPAVGQTVIRGQQGRRVMNLSNGLSSADASGNSSDHAQTAEAILASSIEVLRGPSTLLYGGGAIGGVVNVIDRRIATTVPEAAAFVAETRHDSAADMNTVVGALDFSTGSLVWHLDGLNRSWNDMDIPGAALSDADLDAETTRGYIANTGGETTNTTAGASWILDRGYIGLAVSRLDNNYGLPPGAHAHEDAGEDEHDADFVAIDMQSTRYDLSGEWQQLAPWAEKLGYRLAYTDYRHAEVEGNGATGTRFSNESWQQRLQLTHTDTIERHGVLGLQSSSEEFAALGEESFIPVTSIDTLGLFTVEDFHRNDLTLELGARINQDRYSPRYSAAPGRDFTTWSVSASTLWDMSSTATLGLAMSRSQRAPSVEELYSNHGLTDPEQCVLHFASASCEVGSVNFREETSLNTDLTLNLDYGRFSATITAFYNRFDDYIGQITRTTLSSGFPLREYQQDDARFSGIEVDANFELNAYTSLRIFGDTISGRFDSNGRVPRMPPARYGMELSFKGERWSASAQLMHATRQDEPGYFETQTGSWTRLDVGADYSFSSSAHSELLLFIKGRNLGDSEIRLATSYLRNFAPESGRSIETGIRYRY